MSLLLSYDIIHQNHIFWHCVNLSFESKKLGSYFSNWIMEKLLFILSSYEPSPKLNLGILFSKALFSFGWLCPFMLFLGNIWQGKERNAHKKNFSYIMHTQLRDREKTACALRDISFDILLFHLCLATSSYLDLIPLLLQSK